MHIIEKIYYSFPFRLLINNLRHNHILLLCWVLLFSIVLGNFGKYLGMPYLFLDPEYLQKVGFLSFMIMGVVLAGFSIAFHITCYIISSHHYGFLGSLRKPFTHFSINNSIIPLVFFIVYIISIIRFQKTNEFADREQVIASIIGVSVGYLLMIVSTYTYLWFTNKDIFKMLADRVDKRLKRNLRVTRAQVMARLKRAKNIPENVHYYLDIKFKFRKITDQGYDKLEVLKVFDQNHLNLIIIELLIFLILMLLGVYREFEIFQIPAAASMVLFLTIFVMFSGAFSYWFRSWKATAAILLLIIINFSVKENFFKTQFQAYGLNYNNEKTAYINDHIDSLNSEEIISADFNNTLQILKNWRSKFQQDEPPKMVFVCASGGGQRSSIWTFRVLQQADSITNGNLFEQTMLITGASGGLVGSAYYRALKLEASSDTSINVNDASYLRNISKDNLNPVIFSLLVNDLFVKFQTFKYGGYEYLKDRGHSFEEQLNRNTNYILDKPLRFYAQSEQNAAIPMMIIAPTIINDGKKLYISPQNVSYLNTTQNGYSDGQSMLTEGVDFLRFFKYQGSENLRFLSALRMGATFPYITPNISLPSEPSIEIMDAGITDNFGISDAVRFLFTFKDWITQNTNGVIILSIRDSKKITEVPNRKNLSLIDKISTPIQGVYENLSNMQSISNDTKVEYAKSWFDKPIDFITLQYAPTYDPENQKSKEVERASLSWRLTSKEKLSVVNGIYAQSNQDALKLLAEALE